MNVTPFIIDSHNLLIITGLLGVTRYITIINYQLSTSSSISFIKITIKIYYDNKMMMIIITPGQR